MAKMVWLQTGRKKTIGAHFNPLNILKISPTEDGNTFLDMCAGSKWSSWTIYEEYNKVLDKINEGLENG